MGFTSYHGPSTSFPPMSQWKSFEEIFNANKPEMSKTGNTGEDIGRIWNAVLECAKLGVEERVIFSIIMQESTGNVGVQTTFNNDGHSTAGLMQCDGSPGFPGKHGLSQVSDSQPKPHIWLAGFLRDLGRNHLYGPRWYASFQGELEGVWERRYCRLYLQSTSFLQLGFLQPE